MDGETARSKGLQRLFLLALREMASPSPDNAPNGGFERQRPLDSAAERRGAQQ